MIPEKRLLANRINASKSTGPRTSVGKYRASRNAVRHGLFSILLTAGSSEKITQIAKKLCEYDPFPYRYDVALEVAEAQIMLNRIRVARAKDAAKTFAVSPKLEILDCYERRALARRRRAIRKFDALRDDGS